MSRKGATGSPLYPGGRMIVTVSGWKAFGFSSLPGREECFPEKAGGLRGGKPLHKEMESWPTCRRFGILPAVEKMHQPGRPAAQGFGGAGPQGDQLRREISLAVLAENWVAAERLPKPPPFWRDIGRQCHISAQLWIQRNRTTCPLNNSTEVC
jgi:hypothetical protein